MRGYDVGHYLKNNASAPLSSMRIKKLPKGNGRHSLCGRCNNFTGHAYVNSYVSWVQQGYAYRSKLSSTNSLSLPFHIFPGRVFKEIIAIFAATSGHGLFDANPELRRIVLNKYPVGLPAGIRLYCYIVNAESLFSRQSGVCGLISSGEAHCFAEFAFRPFGYVLTLSGSMPPDKGLFDISFFGSHGYREFRSIHLPLPVRSVETYFPADFRNKEEWSEANRNR